MLQKVAASSARPPRTCTSMSLTPNASTKWLYCKHKKKVVIFCLPRTVASDDLGIHFRCHDGIWQPAARLVAALTRIQSGSCADDEYLAQTAKQTLLHWRNRAGNDGFDVISGKTTPSQRVKHERYVFYSRNGKESAQLSPGWRRKPCVTP